MNCSRESSQASSGSCDQDHNSQNWTDFFIPSSRPNLELPDFNYISDIINSRQVAKGRMVSELEQTMEDYLGVRKSIAVSHGTAALHLALLALGVNQGDEVIIPSYTCLSLMHAVSYVGAKPIFVDIDPENFNPTREMVEECITSRTKAVLLTHTFGFPADLGGIGSLGVPIIEDCAHALGAKYNGRPIGSFGVISILSFYATKMICSGEGGMVCTNDASLAARIQDLTTPEFIDDEYEVRYNYKMSDLVAGLALNQLRRLPEFIAQRMVIAGRYRDAISGSDLVCQKPVFGSEGVYYRFVVKTERPDDLIRSALNNGIQCDRPVLNPLHKYKGDTYLDNLKHTDSVWQDGVSVPIYPDLTSEEISSILTFLQSIGGAT